MSTATLPVASLSPSLDSTSAVSPSIHTRPATHPVCRECGAWFLHHEACGIGPDRPTARVLPADCGPVAVESVVLAVEPADYTAEDQAWWAEHCDHSDWTLAGELSPDEQDAEWERSEILDERAAMVAAWDRYESGRGWE